MIPHLLRISGTAVSQLTTRPVVTSTSSNSHEDTDTPELRKSVLQRCTHDLFKSIGEVTKILHAQIADLQAEKVIPAAQVRYIPPAARPGQQPEERLRDSEATVTNGGLGDLDIGILNARAGVKQVGGEKILDRVQAILEALVKQAEREDEDKMAVDS